MTDPKTIIFSFDGTGNEPGDSKSYTEDESISNILKLHILLGGGILTDRTKTKTANGSDQVTHYYNGIGTRESALSSVPLLGKLITKVQQYVNQGLAPSWGDVRRILAEAMEDFEKSDYDSRKDKIVVFGFSRGAALARKFAAMLINKDASCKIDFLGVFDTVAAMDGIHRKGEKISSDVVFENGTLHENVQKAVHIVSLDEDRVSFTPTLINHSKTPGEPQDRRILEVWFPGVHSDIGGGYWHDGLSDVALQFMINQCRKKLGVSVHITNGTDPSVVEKLIKDQRLGDEGIVVDDVVVNEQVDGELHTHSGLLAELDDSQPRSVHVNIDDRPSSIKPLIHHTVKDRFKEVSKYRPPALRGKHFDLLLDNESRQERRGVAGLRET